MNRVQGTVKFFREEQGYGFISPVKGKDVFVHARGLMNRESILQKGDFVSFNIEEGQKGPQATNVEILENLDEETAGNC